jgi:hypothetical protein
MKCTCGHTKEPGEFRCMVCGLDSTLTGQTPFTPYGETSEKDFIYANTQNEPQLSAEMREKLYNILADFALVVDDCHARGLEPDCNKEIALLATALNEQREKYIEQVEKLKKPESHEIYCGCDGECFASCDASYNKALYDIKAILGGEK